MKEKIRQNTMLAILGAGCTKDYAEKTTEELMNLFDSVIKQSNKSIFNDIQDKSEESYMTDEDGNNTTGRLIKNKDLEDIRKKYVGE